VEISAAGSHERKPHAPTISIIAAAIAVVAASQANAECFPRVHVAAYLNVEHGLSLKSWGLDDAGNMVELFMGKGGNWAVVTTTPLKCATVAMPHKLHGRLVATKPRNKVIAPENRMTLGAPM